MRQKRKTRVLITYIKTGGGHKSIAEGLKERLEEAFGDNIEIIISDPVNSWMDYAYQASAAVSPVLFNLFYSLSKSPRFITTARKVNSLVNEKKLKKYIRLINPDIIISTHFLIADEAKDIRKEDGREIPVVIYIADPFHPHPIWFNSSVDLFLSFDRENLPKNIPSKKKDKIIPIGMPIRKAFFRTYNREKVLKEMGFQPDKFTIVFGGSGSGMDRLERVANKFKELESDSQAIFICGSNKVIQKALTVLFRNTPQVKVFGYLPSETVAAILQSSDLFIGKVGPNIMFESILSGIPIIATPPILGQEILNRKFIKSKKLGVLTKSSTETIKCLQKILKKPETIQQQKNNMIALRDRLMKREENGLPQFINWMEENVISNDIIVNSLPPKVENRL